MVVFVGEITVSMGASGEDKEDIANVVRVVYREVPQPSLNPITVMNQVKPVGFREGHKWIVGEIHVKSEAYEAIHNNGSGPVDYLPPGAAAPACPYLVIKVTTSAGAGWTATVTGAKFSSEELAKNYHGMDTTRDEEGVMIYKFVATDIALAAD